jgi:uncharacterized tellurite resistance protein B-like protein
MNALHPCLAIEGGELILLLVIAAAFAGGYFLISRIIDWAKRQTHGDSSQRLPTAGRPAAAPAAQAAQPGKTPPQLEGLFHLFTMMGKLAMCDGDLTEQETAFVDRCLGEIKDIDAASRTRLLEMLRRANGTSTTFRYHAEGFHRLNKENPVELGRTLERLRALAAADAAVGPAEEALLREAAAVFGLR